MTTHTTQVPISGAPEAKALYVAQLLALYGALALIAGVVFGTLPFQAF